VGPIAKKSPKTVNSVFSIEIGVWPGLLHRFTKYYSLNTNDNSLALTLGQVSQPNACWRGTQNPNSYLSWKLRLFQIFFTFFKLIIRIAKIFLILVRFRLTHHSPLLKVVPAQLDSSGEIRFTLHEIRTGN